MGPVFHRLPRVAINQIDVEYRESGLANIGQGTKDLAELLWAPHMSKFSCIERLDADTDSFHTKCGQRLKSIRRGGRRRRFNGGRHVADRKVERCFHVFQKL